MKRRLPSRELDNLGFLCISLAILPAIGLWEWISSAVSQPEYALDYSRLAQYAWYGVAPVVVGVGFYLRSFHFGYIGGLVLSAASLVHLVLIASGAELPFKAIAPLALLVLLPTRYRALFAGTSAVSAERVRRATPE